MSGSNPVLQAAAAPFGEAQSLPFEIYHNPDWLAAEQAHVFTGEWVMACTAEQVANPGDCFALQVANEPVLVIRDDEGHLQAFANICRHRGTLLVDEGPGHIDKYITCPYHAWAYARNGELKAVPYSNDIAVDRNQHALTPFAVEEWCSLIFVNLDPKAPSLAQRLAQAAPYLEKFAPQTYTRHTAVQTEHWNANWKLAMENAMESYHLFKVHEQTLEVFSPTRDAYYLAGCTEWSLTGGATQRQKGVFERLFGGASEEWMEHYLLILLPPTFVAVLSYGSLGWFNVQPVDATHSIIRSGAVAHADMPKGDKASEDFTAAFFAEDKFICERVQGGMTSSASRGGQLVDMERIVVDFHRFWANRLGAGQPTEVFADPEQSPRWLT